MDRIESLVSPAAIKEITDLSNNIKKAYGEFNSFLQIATSLSTEFKTSSKSVKEMADVMGQYHKAMTDAKSSTDSYNKSVEDLNKLSKEEKQNLLDRIARQKQEERTRRELEQTINKERDTLLFLQDALRKEKQARQDSIRMTSSQIGSTNGQIAAMNKLIRQYFSLSEAERKGAQGRELETKIRALRKEIDLAEQSVGRFQRNVGNYRTALSGALRTTVGFVPGLSQLTSGLGAVGIAFALANQGLRQWIATGKEYEYQNAILSTIMNATRNEMSLLREQSYQLGLTTEWMASQVAEAQIELARLGFGAVTVTEITKPLLGFATALNAGLAESARLAGATLRNFKLTAMETEQALETMTVAANKSAIDFNFLSNAMRIVGASASVSGVSLKDTMALLGTLANSGLDASRAATALRNIFLYMADDSKKLGKALKDTDMTAEGLSSAFKRLRDSGKDLGDLFQLTDKRAVNALAILVQNAEQIVVLREELDNLGGTLDRIRRERLDTMHGSTLLLKSAWEGLLLAFNNYAPFRGAIDWLTKLTVKTSELIKQANTLSMANPDYATLTPEAQSNVTSVSNGMTDRLNDMYKVYENEKDLEKKKLLWNDIVELQKQYRESAKAGYIAAEEEARKTLLDVPSNIGSPEVVKRMRNNAQLIVDSERKILDVGNDIAELQKVINDPEISAIVKRDANESIKALGKEKESLLDMINSARKAQDSFRKVEATSGGRLLQSVTGMGRNAKVMEEYFKNNLKAAQHLREQETIMTAINGVQKEFARTQMAVADNEISGIEELGKQAANNLSAQREAERKARERVLLESVKRSMDAEKAIYENETESYEKRLAALERYLDAANRLTETKAQVEEGDVRAAAVKRGYTGKVNDDMTVYQRQLINDQKNTEMLENYNTYQSKLLGITKKYTEDTIKLAKEETEIRITEVKKRGEEEKELLSEQFKDGLIGRRNYQRALARIEADTQEQIGGWVKNKGSELGEWISNFVEDEELAVRLIAQLEKEISAVETQIAKANRDVNRQDGTVSRRDANRKSKSIIAAGGLSYQKMGRYKTDDRDEWDMQAKVNSVINSTELELAQDIYGRMADIANTYYDNEIQRMDEVINKQREMYEDRLNVLDYNNTAGLLSDEYYTAQKAQLLKKQEEDEKKLTDKKRELQMKQARWQKASSIVSAIIGVATGVSNALSLGLPGIVIAGIIAALGAVQIATIAAQKVPEYAHGTTDHPGGLAVVGDGGKHEYQLSPSGEVYKTPNRPTLIDLPKHSKVFKDKQAFMDYVVSEMKYDSNIDKEGNVIVNNLNDEVQRQSLSNIAGKLDRIRANQRYSIQYQRTKNFYAVW